MPTHVNAECKQPRMHHSQNAGLQYIKLICLHENKNHAVDISIQNTQNRGSYETLHCPHRLL